MPTTVVAEASDPVQAGIWLDALNRAGIQAGTFERGVGAALGGAVTSGLAVYPIIVPDDEVGRARSVIASISGGAVIAPIRDSATVRASQRRALLTVGGVVAGIIVLALAARLAAG